MRIATLALVLATIATPCLAQTPERRRSEEEISLRQLDTSQRAVYALNLGLTDAEGTRFWPIYDQYEAEIKRVTDERVELLNDFADRYQTLTDADAEAMLARIWRAERDALRTRQKYAVKVQKVLPAVKALRYVQLQARIDNQLLGRFMSLIPLAR